MCSKRPLLLVALLGLITLSSACNVFNTCDSQKDKPYCEGDVAWRCMAPWSDSRGPDEWYSEQCGEQLGSDSVRGSRCIVGKNSDNQDIAMCAMDEGLSYACTHANGCNGAQDCALDKKYICTVGECYYCSFGYRTLRMLDSKFCCER